MKLELAELMNEKQRMLGWSYRVKNKLELSTEDKEICDVVDVWAKSIGNGERPAYELSEFVRKTIQPEFEDIYTDEIIGQLFNQGSIGEFDSVMYYDEAKNTLVAHEAAKNGNVDASWLDYKALNPQTVHLQIDTEVKMDQLRKGGYKTVAEITVFAEEALRTKMFNSMFERVDTLITGLSGQNILSAAKITLDAADEFSNYLTDRDGAPVIIGLSTLMRQFARLQGYEPYLSEEFKSQINKYGKLDLFQGCKLTSLSAAKKLGDGSQLLPNDRVFGIAGVIGQMDMRGALRVLATEDNNKEVIRLKYTGFEWDYVITKPENIAKITVE